MIAGETSKVVPDNLEKIISEWFPSNAYEHAETPELEVYPPEDAYRPASYSEIWIPLKKK